MIDFDRSERPQDEVRRSAFERFWPLILGMLTGLGFRLVFWGAPKESFNVMMASFTFSTCSID